MQSKASLYLFLLFKNLKLFYLIEVVQKTANREEKLTTQFRTTQK